MSSYQGAWSGWLKELASRNICSIYLTLDTFQLLSGWLKELALLNRLEKQFKLKKSKNFMKHLVHIRHSNSMSRIASPSSHSSVFKLRPNFIVACLTAKVSSWVHGNRRRICTSLFAGKSTCTVHSLKLSKDSFRPNISRVRAMNRLRLAFVIVRIALSV